MGPITAARLHQEGHWDVQSAEVFQKADLPKNQEPWELIPNPKLPVGIRALEVTAEFSLVWGFLKSLKFTWNLEKPW